MTAEIAKTIQLFYEKSELAGEPRDWLNDAATDEEFRTTAYGLVGDYDKLRGVVMALVISGVVSRDELLGAIECVDSQRGLQS